MPLRFIIEVPDDEIDGSKVNSITPSKGYLEDCHPVVGNEAYIETSGWGMRGKLVQILQASYIEVLK